MSNETPSDRDRAIAARKRDIANLPTTFRSDPSGEWDASEKREYTDGLRASLRAQTARLEALPPSATQDECLFAAYHAK